MLNKCTNKLIVVNLIKQLSMKNLILIILASLFFTSCVSVEFATPQPTQTKNLKKYPKELRGTYQVRIVSGDNDPLTDTLIIADRYYLDQSKKDPKVFLSDSCILRPFKNHHFINFKGTGETTWTTALLILEENNNIKVLGLFAGEDMEEEPFIDALNAITKVNRSLTDDGGPKYDISPSNEELSRLVDERFFKPVYELIRIE